jgi:hypothetical protein
MLKSCLGSDYEQYLQPPPPPVVKYPPVVRDWYSERSPGDAHFKKVLLHTSSAVYFVLALYYTPMQCIPLTFDVLFLDS